MAHAHDHAEIDYGRAFAVGVGLNLAYVVVEAVAGFFLGSLALLADAGHNLSDVLGLVLAWVASRLTKRAPTERRTYGFRRSSIVAALMNAMLLLLAVGGICWEAIRRLLFPEPPPSASMVWVAAAGVAVNAVTAFLFLHGRERDVNIRGAFLHMAADAVVSLGVVAAGIAIYFTGWAWLDPAVSLLVAAMILLATWGLLRESLELAMDAVPRGIDPQAVERYLSNLPGVAEVHDLHIWGLSTTESALTAHLVVPEPRDEDQLLRRIGRELHDLFEIHHPTIQIERGVNGVCPCGAVCRVRPPNAAQKAPLS